MILISWAHLLLYEKSRYCLHRTTARTVTVAAVWGHTWILVVLVSNTNDHLINMLTMLMFKDDSIALTLQHRIRAVQIAEFLCLLPQFDDQSWWLIPDKTQLARDSNSTRDTFILHILLIIVSATSIFICQTVGCCTIIIVFPYN